MPELIPFYTVLTGYRRWASEPARTGAEEVDFGRWWSLTSTGPPFSSWRVSWIVRTGELYAKHCASDDFIALGRYSNREIEARMAGWSASVCQSLCDWFPLRCDPDGGHIRFAQEGDTIYVIDWRQLAAGQCV